MKPTHALEKFSLDTEPEYCMGVDPSKSSTGYALVSQTTRELITYGKCTPDKDLDFETQLLEHYNLICEVLDTYKIRAVVCEDQFFQNNANVMKQLSRVSAMTMLACKQRNIPFVMKPPAAWRKTYLGYGKQTKNSKRITFDKVVTHYGLEKFKFTKDNDITDAIGLANTCVSYVEDGVL